MYKLSAKGREIDGQKYKGGGVACPRHCRCYSFLFLALSLRPARTFLSISSTRQRIASGSPCLAHSLSMAQCARQGFRPSYRNHGQSRQALTIRPMPRAFSRCIHGAFRKRNSREYRRSVRPVPGTPRNPWAGQVKLPTRPTVSVFLVFQFACSGNAQYAGKHERCEIRVTSAYLVKNLP